MKNTLRRYSQIIFFLIFIVLLIQTEYKGSDQLGTPVRFFLGLDPLIATAVLAAAEGILLYLIGLAVGVGLFTGGGWLAKKLLSPEKWNDTIEAVLTRYLPLALIIGFFSWAIFPFGIERGFAWVMALGIVTVAVTLLLGRVFCGWVCPMGAVLQFTSWLRKEPRKQRIEKNQFQPSQRWKYYILIGIFVGAIFGFQIVGIMDPISLVIRGFGLVVSPVVNMAVNGLYDFAYDTGNDAVIGVADELYRVVGYPNVLSFNQPHFAGVILVAAMFIGVIALNWVRPRFWCRVLCPLGALLGTISRNTPYRLQLTKEACHGCGACSFNCQGACDPEFKEGWRPAECFVCFYCVDSCPSGALKFSFQEKTKVPEEKRAIGLDVPRRRVLQAAGTALVAVPLLKATEQYKIDVGGATSGPAINNPALIRPPGALPEDEFLDRCIRCGECMKVCPTNGLHPTTLEAGAEGMWTPILIPQVGYCEYYCTLCGQVCPTGAIEELDVQTKIKTNIGTAFFDVDRCLPYAFATPCIVCEEHCPTAPKAIWFEEVPRASRPEEHGFAPNAADPYGANPAAADPYGDGSGGGEWASATEQAEPDDSNAEESSSDPYTQDPYGGAIQLDDTVLQPKIDLELCIGCGICEKVCVVADEPAVRITAVGESRSQTNRIRFEGSYENY